MYVAQPSPHRRGAWEVRKDSVLFAEGTQAECEATAFALNALSQRFVLRYRTNEWDPAEFNYVTVDYDGPTEGI